MMVGETLAGVLATMLPWSDPGWLSSTAYQVLMMAVSHGIGALLCVDIAARKGRQLMPWGLLGLAIGPLAALLLLVLPALPSAPQHQRR